MPSALRVLRRQTRRLASGDDDRAELSQMSTLLSRSALAMTDTELKVMAALAIIGLSRRRVSAFSY